MSVNRNDITNNFKKARGSINKVIHMLENENYCIDIMQQNLAAIGLLKAAHQKLMEDHLGSCFTQAMSSTNSKRKREMIGEILKVTKMVNK